MNNFDQRLIWQLTYTDTAGTNHEIYIDLRILCSLIFIRAEKLACRYGRHAHAEEAAARNTEHRAY